MQRVLLIDDTEALHRPIKCALTIDGIDVYSAFDGISGICQAQILQPDLILLDVVMPGLNGYEVCERLSKMSETSRIPVIFVSSIGEPVDRVRGLDLGATDFIRKPFDVDELRARVRRHLRHKATLDQASWTAMHDGLTGIWSRSYFNERYESEIALSRRHHSPLSLVMIDVDHFKKINDSLGHATGDTVLRCLAETIDACRRIEDVACRYGGEEFVVICPGVESRHACVLAERIRKMVASRSFSLPMAELQLTCSCGVAGGIGKNDILQAADQALYRAKHAGRNCVVESVEEEVETKA